MDRITTLKIRDLLSHMIKNYTSSEIEEALSINNIRIYSEMISTGEAKDPLNAH